MKFLFFFKDLPKWSIYTPKLNVNHKLNYLIFVQMLSFFIMRWYKYCLWYPYTWRTRLGIPFKFLPPVNCLYMLVRFRSQFIQKAGISIIMCWENRQPRFSTNDKTGYVKNSHAHLINTQNNSQNLFDKFRYKCSASNFCVMYFVKCFGMKHFGSFLKRL